MSSFDLFLGCLAPLLWGMNMVFCAWALETLSPLAFTSLRMIVIIPLAFLFRLKARDFWALWPAALIWGCGHYGLLSVGLKMGTPSYLASILLQTSPLFSALLSIYFFREHITPYKWGCIGLSFLGILFIYLPKLSSTVFAWDYVWILLSAGCMAFTTLLLKRNGTKIKPLDSVIWIGTLSSIPLTLLWVCFEPCTLDELAHALTLKTLLCILFAGWISMTIGMKLWSSLLSRHSISSVAVFLYLVPVFNALFCLALGEEIIWSAFPAFIAIIGGVAFLQFERPLKHFFRRPSP